MKRTDNFLTTRKARASLLLLTALFFLAGCQCVRLEDYRVCDATVDCGDAPDASLEDDGGIPPPADGGGDGGCVPDGQVDALDLMGLDTDCDGVDGVMTRQLYVDKDRGDDTKAVPGNPSQPWASIGRALTFAADAGGYDAVLVKSGAYDELDVEWAANVDIWGGRSGTGTWAPTPSMSNLRGGRVALFIRGVQGRTLRGFQVRAAAGPNASIGVFCDSSSPRFVDVQFYAAEGGAGVAGETEVFPDAGPGRVGNGGVASGFTDNIGPPGVCGGDPGLAGGAAGESKSSSGHVGEGPFGGAPGRPPTTSCNVPSGQAGSGGEGDAGVDGIAGPSATDFGVMGDKLAWTGADGLAGGFGGTGKPGSGGGGGGAPNNGRSDSSSGGSGGSGGCPGARGLGGRSGGPSLGLMVRSGRPFIGEDAFIFSAAGGNGGAGGPPGTGLLGGAGGGAGPPPSNPECVPLPYGTGGPGGRGGRGGSGGRGGGGAGGHSFAIFCDLDGGFELDGGTLQAGAAGMGAGGARAGASAIAQGCAP